jgi:putative nucleotidyltransferase with HDIG domain
MAVMKYNFRRLLSTIEAISELGPTLTSERDFAETSKLMLTSLMGAIAVKQGVLFRYTDRPSMLSSEAESGFTGIPQPAVLPLLPKHVHALSRQRTPIVLDGNWPDYLTSNGNFPPDLLRCLVPLNVMGKLVGLIGLGYREDGAAYSEEDLEGMGLMSHYIALGLHNHALNETLSQRVGENLRLMATIHNFYDTTLEAFAAAIDVKHVNIHGHSLRVGRYASGIGEALGWTNSDVAGLRAAGYLHDVGKVAVDKALFGKNSALSADEFREMADHTVVGHQIVHGIQFPWPHVQDVVRWHHERADGTGYPDRLRSDEISETVRVMAVADTFDAMTSERPYRNEMSVGEALTELVKMTPTKYDPNAVQALLLQIRRDAGAAVAPRKSGDGAERVRFCDERLSLISPMDVDMIASTLMHKINHGRTYSA